MNKNILTLLSSVRITVVCLFLLFVLTFWGTVAQVHQGLYAAQERFFNSFFFLAGGWCPFPGAQLVLWVLFINLASTTITRFIKYRNWPYAGILVIHFGLLLYFLAAFVTFHLAKESAIHLLEHEGTNLSSSYHEWEISFWREKTNVRHVTAIDVNAKTEGTQIYSSDGIEINLNQFYANAAAFTKAQPSSGEKFINASGISLLQPKDVLKEREKNIAGATFTVVNGPKKFSLLLYGGESKPTALKLNGITYYFQMRHKRFELPFTIKLDEFKADFHPGTSVAKSYESYVDVIKPGATRQVRIYMNNPLRDKDYTLYQASYDIDQFGRKYSTLAVVKNGWRVLPYIACLTVFAGLALHFLMAAFRNRGPRRVV